MDDDTARDLRTAMWALRVAAFFLAAAGCIKIAQGLGWLP